MKLVLPLIAAATVSAAPVAANEFTWAVTTDPQTMDPHAVNSAPVLGFLNTVYEGLVRRGKDMSVEPALATAWVWRPARHRMRWRQFWKGAFRKNISTMLTTG